MTSSPPDISSLSLSSHPSQQRLHDTYDYEGNINSNSRPPHFFQTSPALSGQSQYNPLGMNHSPLKNKPVRSALPTQWLDNNSPDSRSLSPHNNSSDFSSAGGSPPPMGHLNVPPMAPSTPSQNTEDEIIPTAIVIKNIPFNVKRETLLDIIASLSIPTPYAFNYHLDQQGSFRGLAFANFRQAADADAVVAALNGFDVQGRKLRVEYKKVLQAGEKERIEREKAIRRMRSMQLEKEQNTVNTPLYEDYGSAISSAFSPQRSFSSGSPYQQAQYSPPNVSSMPTPQYGLGLNSAPIATTQAPQSATPSVSGKSSTDELDLNDPSTLEIYSRILLFKDDRMRDELAFSRSLSPKQRRVVHLLAQKLGVYHYSVGEGDERYVVVTRIDPQRQQQQSQIQQQGQRTVPHTLSRAPSAYLTPTSQVASTTLRAKKSMPDMKTLHSQAPRLSSRASNGNIREGYATIASPSRRVSTGFGSLFSNGSPFASNGGSVPPVPSLPSSINSATLNGSQESPTSNVLRQPRGPGIGGFGRRDSRVGTSEAQAQAQSRVRSDSLQEENGRDY
ncbi:putative R3H domain containing protein [Lyophyllum shimeji]|uniref:R3H domain containing protein n=1 Tax=Lyophyllum shimeji TaxID=47721 RepID=A0A9P3PG00_LYOSH|nr:putative R3H domain containing protein [Lyophyllum shimeji]